MDVTDCKPIKQRRMNWCRGSVGAPTQGGMDRANTVRCQVCAKRVRVTKSGRTRAHGTRTRG